MIASAFFKPIPLRALAISVLLAVLILIGAAVTVNETKSRKIKYLNILNPLKIRALKYYE